MSSQKKIRVIIGKVSLDGVVRGARGVASFLRDAGMEVFYLGSFNSTKDGVEAAIQEDVDVIGLSFLSGEHLTYTPMVAKLLREKELDDVLLIIGGIFPRQDIPLLREMGASEVFIGGSPMESIIEYIKNNARR